MRAIDYQEHNAKVRALWEAYHLGRPARVPMIVGTNVRFTAFGHPANPRGIDFQQYFGDPQTMLTRHLEHLSWARHHVPQDAEMGLPEPWDVHVDFQNSYEAGWLGCPLRYLDGEVRGEVRRILSSGITEGGRFVLREANNLPPGVSLDNLWAMYAAVEEFGRYA